MLHAPVQRGRAGGVKLARAGARHDLGQVALGDPSPGHDDDALTGPLHQLGQEVQPLKDAGFLSRREDPLNPEGDHRFECLERVAGDVEDAMERHAHRARQLDQGAGALHVHAPVLLQDPEDHAVRPRVLGKLHVALHHLELRVGVAGIPAPWADEYVQLDF